MFDLKFAFLLNFLKKKMKEATYQGFLEDICLFWQNHKSQTSGCLTSAIER